jgi:hypothetical protein
MKTTRSVSVDMDRNELSDLAKGAEVRLCGGLVPGGYGAFARPYDRELEQLRNQAAFGRFVEQRALSMSAAERRQFDALLRWPPSEGARRQSKPQR